MDPTISLGGDWSVIRAAGLDLTSRELFRYGRYTSSLASVGKCLRRNDTIVRLISRSLAPSQYARRGLPWSFGGLA